MLKPLFLLSALVAVLTCVTSTRAETWNEITSPHFTVITNGSEIQAREIALGFEQIHGIFAQELPGFRTDSGAQTIVFAAKDEDSFKDLLTPAERSRTGKITGEFRKGWEKDYVLVRLDIPNANQNVVYHEYIHKLLALNFTRIPVWLDEGLAEFFANTRISPEGVYIGAASPRINQLRSRTAYPLQTMLSVNRNSPYYRDEDKVGMFYAEAWGLTHFLMFGPDMGNGQRMHAYLQGLQQGQDSEQLFEQVFGDLDQVQKQFATYIERFSFPASRVDNPPAVDPSAFAGGPVSQAEIDAQIGEFFLYAHDLGTASEKLMAALAADPKSALAHENAGFLYFQQGKDGEAQNEFDQAAQLNPNSYLAVYYQAMLRYRGKTDPDSASKLDAALRKVLQLNPRYAPALIVRSQANARQGKLQDAYDLAIQAQKLEPDRAGYHTNVAAILLLGHDYENAIKRAEPVAARWSATDSAEALAVVADARRMSGIPQTAGEKAQEDGEMKYAAETLSVEGTVKSVTCRNSRPLELILQVGDKELHLRAGRGMGYGYSDTLWFGNDHFTPCYHLEGMRAVARYFPPSDVNPDNELRWFEIRNELIPSSVSTVAEAPRGEATP